MTGPEQERTPDFDGLIGSSLCRWTLPGRPSIRLLNVAENRTYLVESQDLRTALRVHRPGYNSAAEIRSELDWLDALRDSGLIRTPAVIRGADGRRIQILHHKSLSQPRHMVMFEFIGGAAPDETKDLVPLFFRLGGIAARLHRHALSWNPPRGFRRFHWNQDAVFGAEPRWGSWRSAPNVTPEIARILERLETVLVRRLDGYGAGLDRYGLIHADMRLANLIISGCEAWVIDFDDCGFGWFTYDFAAGISFMEDDPRIPELQENWIEGYCRHRLLPASDRKEMETMVMLRRMALLAWIGSRIDSTEPRKLAPAFAGGTALLAESYLSRFA